MSAPVAHPVVTCEFHEPGPHWKAKYHTGRDYQAAIGTRVVATRAGRVVTVGFDPSYGNSVTVDSGGVHHLYAHLSRTDVRQGQGVTAGQALGLSGVTGNAFGPHLHYEERVAPYGYMDHRRPEFDTGLAAAPTPAAAATTAAPATTVWWQRLAYGVRDSDSVRALQQRLNALGARLPVTGSYLDLTRDAVRAFQRRQGWAGSNADGLIFEPSTGKGGEDTVRRLFPSPRFRISWKRP